MKYDDQLLTLFYIPVARQTNFLYQTVILSFDCQLHNTNLGALLDLFCSESQLNCFNFQKIKRQKFYPLQLLLYFHVKEVAQPMNSLRNTRIAKFLQTKDCKFFTFRGYLILWLTSDIILDPVILIHHE